MQPCAGLSLLTTAEAADYLRLKERKLYELVADRQIPCTKVTGKWLFSRADLDRWLLGRHGAPARASCRRSRRRSWAAATIRCCSGP